MNFRYSPQLTLFLIIILSGCRQEVIKDEAVRIADLDKVPHAFASESSPALSFSGSQENFRDYLKDSENTLYRGEALKFLASLELEESETINRQLLEHKEGKSEAENKRDIEQKMAQSEQALMRSIGYFKTYFKQYPDNQNDDYVLYQLAKAYEFSGDTENSLLTLNKIIQRYPNTWYIDEVQFRRGEILFLFNDYVNSELAYAEVVNNTLSTQYIERARYKLIWSQFKQAKYIEALENSIVLLDMMQAQGDLDDSFVLTGLVKTESVFINDVLRVMGLSLSYKEGTKTIQELIANGDNKLYEPLLYRQLSQLYLNTERTLDAADVYLDYVRLHPNTLLAADFNILAIKTYTGAKLTELLLAAKADFVKNFGVDTIFWNSYDAEKKQNVTAELKNSINDLAKYYHAIASKSGKSQDYIAGSIWYEEYIRTFPDDTSTPMMNFLLAESRYDAEQYKKALNEYLKTAYDYSVHSKSAESGYAAILTYDVLQKQVKKQDLAEKAKLEMSALNNAIRFSLTFKDSSYAPAVISKTTETLYENRDYKRVVEFASQNAHLKNLSDRSHFKTTWLVYGHSLFELKEFASAEQIYSETLLVMSKNDKLYADVSERLAASIYKQAEMYRDLKQYQLASHHFLRVGERVPTSKIYATAQYDAAASLMLLKDWAQATSVLEGFRIKFPKDKKYSQGISEKLVLAYTENGQLEKAANEALILSRTSTNLAERKVYSWMAAELYQKQGVDKKANDIYVEYVTKYPEPFAQNIEAHQRVIDYFRKIKDSVSLKKWLVATVNTEKLGKNYRTDRTKSIASNAAMELADSMMAKFKKIELKIPLKKSLRTKKKLMETLLKSYADLMTYEIADITTASTYHVADIYGHFATALLNSQRPKNLNEEELEQYNILLEEQAYPFEEKAIEIHFANAKRTGSGIYDEWVKKSIAALAILQPIRYSKNERLEVYIENLN